MNKIYIFLIMFFLLCNSNLIYSDSVKAEKYSKIKIYFIDWSIITRSRFKLDYIRNNYDVSITLNDTDEINGFINWLQLEKLKYNKDYEDEDPRLVVDLYHNSGKQISFYASQFNLCSEDSKQKRQIGENFKQTFYLWSKKKNK